jgi:hypothetical protein
VEDMGRLGVITENIEITALSAANQLKSNGNAKGTIGFIMGDKVINNVSFYFSSSLFCAFNFFFYIFVGSILFCF